MTARESESVRIAVPAWLRDHSLDGRAILPAVEILEILADSVQARFPDTRVRIMKEVLFPRFLILDPGLTVLDGRIEWQPLEGDRVKAVLGTEVRSRSGAIGRLAVHGTAVFGGEAEPEAYPEDDPIVLRTDRFTVPAGLLYRDLVPFGPAFRNALDPIEIWEEGAEAALKAPDGRHSLRLLGSPFPLDAALHVACAWCQRYGDTVALPVGFASRKIVRPIAPGGSCRVRIDARGISAGAFCFNLVILDTDHSLREALWGLRMRDVSRGRLRPPAWIRAGRDGSSGGPVRGSGKSPA
jgi:hypothetical protein